MRSPKILSSGAWASMSWLRMLSPPDSQSTSAKKIDQVPSVTMKGGSLILATSVPLRRPQRPPTTSPIGIATIAGTPSVDREPAHDHRAQHHDRRDREVDAGGQDDQRLGDAEDADDRHLADE